MVFLIIVFSSSSNEENRAILSSLFTAIFGILILLAIQWLALKIYIEISKIAGGDILKGLWMALKSSKGGFLGIFLFLYSIGFSYYSALDPHSGFIESFIGFTFGVGLCEELVKLIPVVWLMKKASKKGEILHLSGILLVGLASGVGFGVAEGIMYSAQFYNGIYGWDVYWVRFVTCVALHSTWTGIAVIMLWPHRNELFRVEETTKNEKAKDEKNKEDKEKEKSHISRKVQTVIEIEVQTVTKIFMLAYFSGVAIILHGLYDTLLKKGEDLGALIVVITTFVWFYYLLNERYKKESQI
jgi:RsiW-degrading membrane proteinase PrsW (M82 family)